MCKRILVVCIALFLLISACSKKIPSDNVQHNPVSIRPDSEVSEMMLIEDVETEVIPESVKQDTSSFSVTKTEPTIQEPQTIQNTVKQSQDLPIPESKNSTESNKQGGLFDSLVSQININEYKSIDFNNSGIAYYKNGDYDNAITEFTAALMIMPDYIDALNNRGMAYIQKKQFERAIADFSALLKIKPDSSEALNNRGNAYYNNGNLDLAISDWEAFLRINPNDEEIKYYIYESLFFRGVEYFNNNNFDLAIIDWTSALRINPEYCEALYNRGVAYYKKNDIERAIADWNAVLNIEPTHAGAWNNLEAIRQMQE